ncbi:MAG: DALR anticodon-binding domain-containing protein [Lysobacter sp.]
MIRPRRLSVQRSPRHGQTRTHQALELDAYSTALAEVSDTLEPHKLCGYLYDLARDFSTASRCWRPSMREGSATWIATRCAPEAGPIGVASTITSP